MRVPSAPGTSVGSDPGWVPGHSGTSSEAGCLLGSSLLLGPGPIWPGRTGTGIGSTLHCLSPAPLGPPVVWLRERSPVIAPVIPGPDGGGEIPDSEWGLRTPKKNTLLLWQAGSWLP